MAGFTPKVLGEKPYYRDQRPGRLPAGPGPSVPGPQGPEPDGEVWGRANVASVGSLRELFTMTPAEKEVLSAINPLGAVNQPVLLVRNDYEKPMMARVRLARNGTEGRIAIGTSSTISGIPGSKNVIWLDLATATDRRFDQLLENSDELWAIGTWPGIVPLSVFVTVGVWSPETK